MAAAEHLLAAGILGPAGRAAAAFVLNAIWQVPLLIGAGALLARTTRRAPARTRHLMWNVVLVVAVIAPALGALGLGRAMRPAPRAPAAASVPAAVSASATASAPSTTTSPGPGAESFSIGAPAGGGPDAFVPSGGPLAASPEPGSSLGALWARAADFQDDAARRAPVGLLAVLLLGIPAILGCLRLAGSLLRARTLRRSAAPPAGGDRIVALADFAREALGLGPVTLLVTDEPIAPAALGLLRPAILLPRSLLRDARDAELRAVLAHETAHVARHDAARHVLAETALLPLRFHPLVPLLRRRLAETRELACDEAAAGVVGGARAYARALLDVSAILAGLSRPLTLPGVLGAGLLEVRMRHLTGSPTPWGRMRARLSLALATVALLALAASAIPFALGGTEAPAAAPEAPPAPPAPEAQPAPAPPAPPATPAPTPAPAPPPLRAPRSSHVAPVPPLPRSESTPAAPPAPPAPADPSSFSDLDVTIKVLSATPGRQVEVEGVYVYAPEGSGLHYVKQRTPVEIKTTARLLDGIFSAIGEDATIRIEMKSDGVGRDHATATAMGKTVTIHTNDGSNGWRISTL